MSVMCNQHPVIRRLPFWAMGIFFVIAIMAAMGGQSLGCLHQGTIIAGIAAFVLLFIGNERRKV